jgi:hypothetical protein
MVYRSFSLLTQSEVKQMTRKITNESSEKKDNRINEGEM